MKEYEEGTGLPVALILEYSTDGKYLYMGYFKKDRSRNFRLYPLNSSDLTPVLDAFNDHCSFKFKKTDAKEGYVYRDSMQIINNGGRDQLVFLENRGKAGTVSV